MHSSEHLNEERLFLVFRPTGQSATPLLRPIALLMELVVSTYNFASKGTPASASIARASSAWHALCSVLRVQQLRMHSEPFRGLARGEEMTNIVSLWANRTSNKANDGVHKHQILSRLALCPVKTCRDRAIALFAQAAETVKPKKVKHPTGKCDANERVLGHLREPHLAVVYDGSKPTTIQGGSP